MLTDRKANILNEKIWAKKKKMKRKHWNARWKKNLLHFSFCSRQRTNKKEIFSIIYFFFVSFLVSENSHFVSQTKMNWLYNVFWCYCFQISHIDGLLCCPFWSSATFDRFFLFFSFYFFFIIYYYYVCVSSSFSSSFLAQCSKWQQ